jgi:cell division septum initiation protein DivIVA
MKFTKQRNGYSEKEVDDYISTLTANHQKILTEKDRIILELQSKVDAVKKQENSIALALTAAIDKAKEIELSSKNIYKLKIEQLTILYSKWEMLLNEILRKYPNIEDVSNIKEDVLNLKNYIKSALKDDFNIDLITKTPVTDPIRVLLSRLTGMKANAESRETVNDEIYEKRKDKVKVIERKTRVSASDKTELTKLEERSNQIRPIVNLNLKKGDKYDSLLDKFLNTDEPYEYSDKLAKVVINSAERLPIEGKFDLNEAINPTEDLEEIMKSFDFYNKNKK